MNEKESAVEGAKNAASQSGLVLSFSKAQADSLTHSSQVAAKEAALFASNIKSIVRKLNVLQSIVKQVKSVVTTNGIPAADKVSKIESLIESGGNVYALEEARIEERPSIAESAKGVTKAVANIGLDTIGLAMAIPLLMSNPQILGIVKGFFDGFLTGIGLSSDAIAIVKPVITILLGVLAASWTMSALSPVIEVFQKLKQLATALGLAGEATKSTHDEVATREKDVKKKDTDLRKEKDKIQKEKDTIKKGTEVAKDEVKKAKDEIKKASQAGKGKNWFSRNKAKLLALSGKVVPRLKSMAGNILKAIPVVGTILGIGLVLYDLYSIGSDIYDVFFSEEDKEEPEAAGKPLPASTSTAAPTPAASITGATVPAAIAARSSFASTDPRRVDSAKQAIEVPGSLIVDNERPSTSATEAPGSLIVDTERPSGKPAKGIPSSTSVLSPGLPSDMSQQVIQQSAEVDRMERDSQISQGIVVLNINNNRIVNTTKKTITAPSGSTYSVTVGA